MNEFLNNMESAFGVMAADSEAAVKEHERLEREKQVDKEHKEFRKVVGDMIPYQSNRACRLGLYDIIYGALLNGFIDKAASYLKLADTCLKDFEHKNDESDFLYWVRLAIKSRDVVKTYKIKTDEFINFVITSEDNNAKLSVLSSALSDIEDMFYNRSLPEHEIVDRFRALSTANRNVDNYLYNSANRSLVPDVKNSVESFVDCLKKIRLPKGEQE